MPFMKQNMRRRAGVFAGTGASWLLLLLLLVDCRAERTCSRARLSGKGDYELYTQAPASASAGLVYHQISGASTFMYWSSGYKMWVIGPKLDGNEVMFACSVPGADERHLPLAQGLGFRYAGGCVARVQGTCHPKVVLGVRAGPTAQGRI